MPNVCVLREPSKRMRGADVCPRLRVGLTTVGLTKIGLTKIGIILAILTLPIFSHGCHREDIDDEPALMPPIKLTSPELPR